MARIAARPVLRAVARFAGRKNFRAAPWRCANPVSRQSLTLAGAGASGRLGTGAVGRTVPRTGLQKQFVADAMPRGTARTLVVAKAFFADVASAAARPEHSSAGGADACQNGRRRLFAPSVGP